MRAVQPFCRAALCHAASPPVASQRLRALARNASLWGWAGLHQAAGTRADLDVAGLGWRVARQPKTAGTQPHAATGAQAEQRRRDEIEAAKEALRQEETRRDEEAKEMQVAFRAFWRAWRAVVG